jgi:hypothetical protein
VKKHIPYTIFEIYINNIRIICASIDLGCFFAYYQFICNSVTLDLEDLLMYILRSIKFAFICTVLCLAGAAVAAASDDYPPIGGENLFHYGHPAYQSSADSAAGGPLFATGPYSININPALTAALQCLTADAGFSVFSDAGASKRDSGGAFHIGTSLPTRWGVWTAALQGSFLQDPFNIGNVIAGHFGFSRDVTENLYIGAAFSVGGLFYKGITSESGDDSDFAVLASLGIWYRIKEISALSDKPFLKDIRFGLALQNLGKSFNHATGVEYDLGFPSIFSPKFGAALNLVSLPKIKVGASADAALPLFVLFDKFLFSAGLQVEVANLIFISSGWNMNAKELGRKGVDPYGPYISVAVKFSANTSGSERMSKRGFDQTDIKVEGLWQHMGNDLHHTTLGATFNFGVQDTTPPEIDIDLDDIK